MHQFAGIHIMGELYGISSPILKDHLALINTFEESVIVSGATILDRKMHRFDDGGMTVLLLLAESHASLHTYPKDNALFVDIFTCGLKCNPRDALRELITRLNPIRTSIKDIKRGEFND